MSPSILENAIIHFQNSVFFFFSISATIYVIGPSLPVATSSLPKKISFPYILLNLAIWRQYVKLTSTSNQNLFLHEHFYFNLSKYIYREKYNKRFIEPSRSLYNIYHTIPYYFMPKSTCPRDVKEIISGFEEKNI